MIEHPSGLGHMHRHIIPTAILGLLCAFWFVDHRFMSAKIAALNGTSESQIDLLAQRVADLEGTQRAATAKGDSQTIAKVISDTTSSIPARAGSALPLKSMKNVAVKAKVTSIDGLLH